MLSAMRDRAIVFGRANPDPEFDPAQARRHAAVVATGRSAAAADAIAALVDQPAPDAIIPDVLDERVVSAVAAAVAGCGR